MKRRNFIVQSSLFTAGTGFMHEGFNKDNPSDYSRDWFAWANTLFGELIIKIYFENKNLLTLEY